VVERIEDFVVIILLPLYFTFSGLRTDIGSLKSSSSWRLVILITFTACLGKVLGAMFAAKIMKCNWRESFTIGILMNTKGLVELIVLNVGLDVGVLNTEVFTIFVLMALFTTFITTPLVYMVYVRVKRKAKKVVPPDTFSALLSINNLGTAPWMVTICSIFGGSKENLLVKALLLTEISDRPSSYFFSEYKMKMQEAPWIRDKNKVRRNILAELKNHSKQLGITVTTKPLASADLGLDVAAYASSHACNLLMFDLRTSTDTITSPQTRALSRVSSIIGEASLQGLFAWDPSAKMIQSALTDVPCAIAVVVNKSTTYPDSIQKVLFLFHGKVEEDTALKYSMRIPENVELTILGKAVPQRSQKRHYETVSSVDPEDDCLEYLKNQTPDLIIVGSARNSSTIYRSMVVIMSKIPVMIVYSPFPKMQTGVETKMDDLEKGEVDLPEMEKGSIESSSDMNPRVSPKTKKKFNIQVSTELEEMKDTPRKVKVEEIKLDMDH